VVTLRSLTSKVSGFNNLAELYRSEKKYAEAEPLYRRALSKLCNRVTSHQAIYGE
jgi:hypothetical protein